MDECLPARAAPDSHSVAANDAPYVPAPAPVSRGKPLSSYLRPNDIAPTGEAYVFPHEEPFTSSSPRIVAAPALPSSSTHASASTSISRRGRRTSAATGHHAKRTYGYDSDEDAEADEDEYAESSGDSEDEYVPSPRLPKRKPLSTPASTSAAPRKQPKTPRARRYSPYPGSPASSADSGLTSSTTASGGRRPGSRNVQIFDRPPPPRGSWAKTGPDAYRCPYCEHVQANRRSPDMERHIRSHFRDAARAQWVCCGVPAEAAAAYGVPPGAGGAWVFNGRHMVGGCHEDFSRMDALKRHWKNANNTCVGDVQFARVRDA